MTIYKVTNKNSNKIYIGLTTRSLEERKKEHTKNAKRQRTKFQKDLHKYGIENFLWEEIDTASSIEELSEKEKYWISFYNSSDREKGYNLTFGGWNGKPTEETNEKNRQWHLGRKLSDSHKANISKGGMGKKQGENQKRLVSEKVAKTYKLTFPGGRTEIVTNLSKWGKEQGLSGVFNLSSVAHGKLKHYKGIKAEII